DTALELVIKITARILHVGQGPPGHLAAQGRAGLEAVHRTQGHPELARAMNVDGISAVVIILRGAILEKEVGQVKVQAALDILAEAVVATQVGIMRDGSKVIAGVETVDP